MGMKAEIKQELKALGIKTIKNDKGIEVKLGNAKTTDLLSALTKAKGVK
jgi:hypothetical protein